jgi:hypothetical protein
MQLSGDAPYHEKVEGYQEGRDLSTEGSTSSNNAWLGIQSA